MPYNPNYIKNELPCFKISVSGLEGGNSGDNIERSSNNAIIAMAKIIPLNLEAEYVSGYFTFKLVDLDTNEVLSGKKLSYTIITGSINTGGSVTTDANGIASIDNSALTVYKMENGTITEDFPIGVSNEFVPDKEAEIGVADGTLLVYIERL